MTPLTSLCMTIDGNPVILEPDKLGPLYLTCYLCKPLQTLDMCVTYFTRSGQCGSVLGHVHSRG